MKVDRTQWGLPGLHKTVRLVDHLTEILLNAEYEIQNIIRNTTHTYVLDVWLIETQEMLLVFSH